MAEISPEEVHDEIQEIQTFIEELSVVSETLRKSPRVIGASGTGIDEFNDQMGDRFGSDDAAYVDCKWDVAGETFIALLSVKETRRERRIGETVPLTTRPLNKDEIESLDEELRENEDFHMEGLTQELYDDLKQFRV